MGDNGSVWLPDAMSTLAGEVDALFWFVFWASTIIFAMVIVAKVYFMVKFQAHGRNVRTGAGRREQSS